VATRKTDVVRRSLFGSADVDERDVDVREQRAAAVRPRTRKKVPRTVEAEAINAGVTRASRRLVERTAITVPSELLLRVKDAVAVLNGWPHQIYTMARFVEEAFTAQLERLKLEHNGGREVSPYWVLPGMTGSGVPPSEFNRSLVTCVSQGW
jgi:hypothetical protein